mgnify:CR=1 FL=1
MAAIKREPVPPPGPIADLFDRLDDLHSKAGRPSMREIAHRAGRGNISSSTVHNLFRRPQVPRWAFLEQAVKALGGDEHQREAFFALWEAAWRAENDVAASPNSPVGLALPHGYALDPQDPPPRPLSGAPLGGVNGRAEDAPRSSHRIWSNEIPSRNPNFTGREAELTRLRENLFSGQPPHVQVISGMGGIGKPSWRLSTSIATSAPTKSSGGSGPSSRTGSGTRWSNWANGSSCARRRRTARVTGRSRPYSKRCNRAPGRVGCSSSITPLIRSTWKSTYPPAGRKGT